MSGSSLAGPPVRADYVAPSPTAAPGARAPLVLLLAAPRGFCAGVRRAIDAVEAALQRFGPPVYVRRPIVHNLAVVRALEAKGAIFVSELDAVPDGAVVITSAHGIAQGVASQARARNLRWFDAVCPLVAKVHREVVRHHAEGRHVVLIGHDGHPEIEGTTGQLPRGSVSVVASAEAVARLPFARDRPVAFAVQTTYSVEESRDIERAIRERFSDVEAPPGSDVCYATSNRQAGVRAIAPRVDAFLVAGADFSSNARRLADVARAAGCAAVQLLDDAEAIDWGLLAGARRAGLTAAASTPDSTIRQIVDALGTRFDLRVEEAPAVVETASFRPLRLD